MMMRPSKQEFFMLMALLCARRATCSRRSVGCVLVDGRSHVLSTGYNGPVAGMPHCIDHKCAGADQPSGKGLDLCEAVHAEENALLQCRDIYAIEACYCTTAPCPRCLRQLMNTSCEIIYYIEDYGNTVDTVARWCESRGTRKMIKLPLMKLTASRIFGDDTEWEEI
jgi:dCMP deaminase